MGMLAWSAKRRCLEDFWEEIGVVEKRFERGERQASLEERNIGGRRAILVM